MNLAPHALALIGRAGMIDVSKPVRLICRCGHATKLLKTAAELEMAAEAHRLEVVGSGERAE